MERQITPFQALERALEVAGSQSALARICGVSQTAVWKWVQSSKRLPAEHVLKVEAATGVSRHLLRPDIYPIEHHAVPPVALPTDDCMAILPRRSIARQSNSKAVLDGRSAA
ncbi:transcriptional regulator [Sphingobium lignivorans]|uniref:DNA-binding transcriptional regulator YdaS (Cro superfamily) n=1 Tax=Sphingobium lignivorans TaxID=2735886 RepID=A0ABR6NDH6_9SPHN|nr:YdaS family helix-turn-helix protein [Sphingobium lignivorans]MBB5985330.1 DNA-binding transcriptional regulator YdaS (Cro superfamily) [Sphingobium lignivorans]